MQSKPGNGDGFVRLSLSNGGTTTANRTMDRSNDRPTNQPTDDGKRRRHKINQVASSIPIENLRKVSYYCYTWWLYGGQRAQLSHDDDRRHLNLFRVQCDQLLLLWRTFVRSYVRTYLRSISYAAVYLPLFRSVAENFSRSISIFKDKLSICLL